MVYRKAIKPLADLLLSLLGLILFSPVGIIITLTILIVDRHYRFFLQPRPGKEEKIYQVIKFKTMNPSKGAPQNKTSTQRITRLGGILRRTSLDEIPQLINVLKGEMSLIGPRPLRVEYLPFYTKEQSRRHSVRPGITGWAQVSGRNTLDWEEVFELDIWYVDHINLKLDLKILVLTLVQVMKREGINQSNQATRLPFKSIKLDD